MDDRQRVVTTLNVSDSDLFVLNISLKRNVLFALSLTHKASHLVMLDKYWIYLKEKSHHGLLSLQARCIFKTPEDDNATVLLGSHMLADLFLWIQGSHLQQFRQKQGGCADDARNPN